MEKTGKIDMTRGAIMTNVFLFALPIVIGNILQLLYTTVDTLVVGHYCGTTALAAIGTSAQPVEILLCIFLGIGTGVSIITSQKTGAADTADIKKVSDTTVFLVYAAGLPISIAGFFVAPLILHLMDTPADTWNEALWYTRIVFLGALGTIGYNMNAGILRGLGDSRASLGFLVVSCFVNIVLDLVFVALFGMGIAGAALATVIAVFASWLTSIVYIQKHFKELDFNALPRRFDKNALRQIIAVGLPIGLNNSLYSFGHVALQTFVNAQGSSFMAGVNVAKKITDLTSIAITGMSSAASAFAGQNYGAGNFARLKKGSLVIPVTSGLVTLASGLAIISLRMPLLSCFTSDSTVLMYASRYVVVMLLCQWFYAIFNGVINIVNGAGLIMYSTVVNILMLWLVRVPSAYIIASYFDGTYVMLCFPISFGFGMIMMLGYYIFSPKWKTIVSKAQLTEQIE